MERTLISREDPDYGSIELSTLLAGPPDGVPVLLCHGFPDLAESWRHQITALAAAGYRVIAPDQRGYADSSAPDPASAYGIRQLTGDLVGILDHFDIDRAVVIGHDWGGFVAWAMALLHAERCLGVGALCTPYTGFPSIELLEQLAGGDPENMYMLWFQEPGVAEAVMNARVREVFDTILVGGIDPVAVLAALGGAGRMNPFLDAGALPTLAEPIDTDLSHYVEVFERTGFDGGIKWYRNIEANARVVPEMGRQRLMMPTLMICAEWDLALPPALAANMMHVCDDLTMTTIARAGHWVQQEAPDEVNEVLLDWCAQFE